MGADNEGCCQNMTTGGKFRLQIFFDQRGELNYRRGDVAQSIFDSNWFIHQATRMYFNFLILSITLFFENTNKLVNFFDKQL